jgi:hypothetical protein
MANLQNYKRVKIRMDDMISQQFFTWNCDNKLGGQVKGITDPP